MIRNESAASGAAISQRASCIRCATYPSRHDVAGACDTLSVFISRVTAQSGKSITPGTATALIADATRIRAVLGC